MRRDGRTPHPCVWRTAPTPGRPAWIHEAELIWTCQTRLREWQAIPACVLTLKSKHAALISQTSAALREDVAVWCSQRVAHASELSGSSRDGRPIARARVKKGTALRSVESAPRHSTARRLPRVSRQTQAFRRALDQLVLTINDPTFGRRDDQAFIQSLPLLANESQPRYARLHQRYECGLSPTP
jgi:hypothetical protein